MHSVYLEKRHPSKHQFRFYHILILPTLFGSWSVLREWGRIGSPGTVRETWYDSEQAALAAGETLLRRKAQRGYRRPGRSAGRSVAADH